MAIPREQIRQIIKENNLKEVVDVQKLLKESFKEVLQEILEAELDVSLGYSKNRKGEIETDNKRNGHSSKTVKSEYGEVEIDIPRDRNGEFEPQIVQKHQRNITGIEDQVISLYARGMANEAFRFSLSFYLHGRHSLQGPRRWKNCK